MEGQQPENKEDEKVYGGCEGPDAAYIKLVSSDGHSFIIKRELAMVSNTIKAMMTGPGAFTENETNVIYLHHIPSKVLQKVCTYFTYKVLHKNTTSVIPEFEVDSDTALDLLMAANFLDC